MRVLVTSTPGTGHLHPLVPLAREFASDGHEVVWATAKSSRATVESFGFRSVACGLDNDARLHRFLERATPISELPPREQRIIAFPVIFAEIAAPVMRDDLTGVFDNVRPDLVVHDFAELAATPMATARNIPSVAVGFSGALSDAVQTAAETSVAHVWESEGVAVTRRGFNGDLLLHPFPAMLDTPRPDGPSAPMRPLSFDGASSTARPDWMTTFGKDRPGVYVSFGTEIAPFAPWSAILEALGDLEVDVLVTVGGQLDPTSLGSTPKHTRVEKYVPQSFVVEQAAVVLSHGGAGTLIGAASAGKLQLCLPLSADQWDNADSLSAANAGMTLEPDERDVDRIRRSVQHLLTTESMQARAIALKDDFASMPHPAEVAATLVQLT